MIRIKHHDIEQDILSSEEAFTTIVISNPHLLIHFITEIKEQISADEGPFVYINNGKESSFKKDATILTDPIQIIRDEKKEGAAVMKEISGSLSETQKENFAKLSAEIISFVEDIAADYPLSIDIDPSFTVQNLLKFVSITPQVERPTFLEQLCQSISVIAHVYSKKLFFFCHLHAYLSTEEFDIFHREALKSDVKIILIEHQRPTTIFKGEQIIEIDNDLCEL